ncbi:MAG: M4 family metallopeptidase, partial [Nocardioidaceae bacterium]
MQKVSGITAAGLLVAVTATLGTGSAQASSPASDDDHGGASQASPSGRLAEQGLAAAADNPGRLAASAHDEFDVTDVLVDADGTRHVRMGRTYNGLDVIGGDVVVHQKPGGTIRSVSKTLRDSLSLSVQPEVRAKTASGKAVRRARGPADISDVRVRHSPTLVVDAVDAAHPRLAWLVVSVGRQDDGTPSRLKTLVDARTGTVLDSIEQIQTADGEGDSLYGGTVPLTTTQNGSSYELEDPTRGNSFTGDAGNETDLCFASFCLYRAPHTLFTDPDNSWGDGTTANRQSAAVDAQYGTDTTWDYYEAVHNQTGIAGDGAGSYNRVHYGQNYVNAFWDPSCFCMTYGDGDGANNGPLTSLDVAGHEMSHGVTSSTANLTYSGESGGLN